MAPLPDSPTSCRAFFKVLSVLLLLLLSFLAQVHSHRNEFTSSSSSTRRMLEADGDEDHPIKIKKTSSSTATSLSSKNKTKLLKPSSKNQTKIQKNGFGSTKNQTTKAKLSSGSSSSPVSISFKNKTKPLKPTSDSSIKKLNSTSLKTSNTTKTNKSSDLLKLSSSSKNKTNTKAPKSQLVKSKSTEASKPRSESKPFWIDDEQDDLVAEFRDMTSKFQQTLLPDLEKISKTSKVYLNKANKEITNNFKPIVGNKYAPTVASFISFAFILIPLILVSLIFNRFKAYFSLQKLLIFVQIYLSIYFSILCLSSLVTGLEPLKFFYATSQSTYICIQLFQTLAYVLYLLLLLMYLVLVFSTETGTATKVIGLGQTIVGFAVGLHYYTAVFHRAVLRQPPKASWRVHAIYATCFLAICLLTQAERRKKAYLEEDGEEGKKS